MIARAVSRLRAHPHRHLLDGSAAALVAVVISAASGFLFWLIAARTSPADDVGKATALISSVAFIAYVTNMGLVVAVGRYSADERPESQARFALACVYTAITGALGSVVYLWLVRSGAGAILGVAGALLFVVITIGTSLGPLVDTRQMARRRWRDVVYRSGAVFVGRVVMLVAILAVGPADERSTLLFLGAAIPDALSGWAMALFLSARGVVVMVRDRALPEVRRAFRYANVNYLSNLAIRGPLVATPVLVLLNVPSDTNAAFYVAWGIFSMVLLIPQSLTNALHVEGKKDGAELRTQVAFGMRMVIVAGLACTVASIPLIWLIPLVYGPDYTASGLLLPWLVVSAVPWSVLMVKLTAARVEERSGVTVVMSVVFAITCLVPVAILTPVWGLVGPAVGWIAGATLSAVVAVVLQSRADRIDHVDYHEARERFIESIVGEIRVEASGTSTEPAAVSGGR